MGVQWNQLSLSPRTYSLGACLGTTGNADLYRKMDEVSMSMGGSYFGSGMDFKRDAHLAFMNQVIEPIRQLNEKFQQTKTAVERQDGIVPITSVYDVKLGIPPAMRIPILTHKPMRNLLLAGRIDGWGITPEMLPEGDPYADILRSGRVDLSEDSEDIQNGHYMLTFIENSDDPDLTLTEVQAIYDTREFMDQFLIDPETEYIDPTDWPHLRG